MTRLLTTGFELLDVAAECFGTPASSTASYNAAAARSGEFGLRPATTENLAIQTVSARWYYARVYFRKDANPLTDDYFFQVTASGSLQVWMNTSGQILVKYGATTMGPYTSGLANNVWHRLEVGWNYIASGSPSFDDSYEVRVNGESLISEGSVAITTTSIASAVQLRAMGNTMDFDDFALNDNQTTSQNTWPGEGRIAWLAPTEDSQIGSWRGGSDTTQAKVRRCWPLMLRPPIGTATETNTTQIESADSSGDNATDEYRGSLMLPDSRLLGLGDSAALGPTYGNKTPSTVSSAAMNAIAAKIILPAGVTEIRRVMMVWQATATVPTGVVTAKVFTDSSGSPGTQVGSSVDMYSAAADIVGSVHLPLVSTFTDVTGLTPGGTYWLTFTAPQLFNAVSSISPGLTTAGYWPDVKFSSDSGGSWGALSNARICVFLETNGGGPKNGDIFTVLNPLVSHGEDVGTGTKTGSAGFQASPSGSYGTFTFGEDVGALGTWPTSWRMTQPNSGIIYNPTITWGTRTIIAARKTDTGTRVGSLATLGAYLEYISVSEVPSRQDRLMGALLQL